MNRLLVFALPLLLGSCTLMTAGSPYTLGKQPADGELNPSGTVSVQRPCSDEAASGRRRCHW